MAGRTPNVAVQLVVLYAVILHIVWAITLFFESSPENVTAVATLSAIFARPALILTLFTVAFCAFIGARSRINGAFILLIPQQLILFVSAGSALKAIMLSQFADGVLRPRAFLIADQAPALIAAFMHLIAVLYKMANENWEKYYRTNRDGRI